MSKITLNDNQVILVKHLLRNSLSTENDIKKTFDLLDEQSKTKLKNGILSSDLKNKPLINIYDKKAHGKVIKKIIGKNCECDNLNGVVYMDHKNKTITGFNLLDDDFNHYMVNCLIGESLFEQLKGVGRDVFGKIKGAFTKKSPNEFLKSAGKTALLDLVSFSPITAVTGVATNALKDLEVKLQKNKGPKKIGTLLRIILIESIRRGSRAIDEIIAPFADILLNTVLLTAGGTAIGAATGLGVGGIPGFLAGLSASIPGIIIESATLIPAIIRLIKDEFRKGNPLNQIKEVRFIKNSALAAAVLIAPFLFNPATLPATLTAMVALVPPFVTGVLIKYIKDRRKSKVAAPSTKEGMKLELIAAISGEPIDKIISDSKKSQEQLEQEEVQRLQSNNSLINYNKSIDYILCKKHKDKLKNVSIQRLMQHIYNGNRDKAIYDIMKYNPKCSFQLIQTVLNDLSDLMNNDEFTLKISDRLRSRKIFNKLSQIKNYLIEDLDFYENAAVFYKKEIKRALKSKADAKRFIKKITEIIEDIESNQNTKNNVLNYKKKGRKKRRKNSRKRKKKKWK